VFEVLQHQKKDLGVLPEKELCDAVTEFVEKESTSAITEFVKKHLGKIQRELEENENVKINTDVEHTCREQTKVLRHQFQSEIQANNPPEDPSLPDSSVLPNVEEELADKEEENVRPVKKERNKRKRSSSVEIYEPPPKKLKKIENKKSKRKRRKWGAA